MGFELAEDGLRQFFCLSYSRHGTDAIVQIYFRARVVFFMIHCGEGNNEFCALGMIVYCNFIMTKLSCSYY